ncbi:secreted RxLR effector protein 161-like [Rutidosis leptorrhynchoides]|uniref:secreted RxLR effector protein 161-like n=1 Tax=Rutidosis leptorrhynchoides TaxID=125765 RepID=UPI003A9A0F9D
MGVADVILCIRIKRDDRGITITQSHYIEKILKRFKCDTCSTVSSPVDQTVKLMPHSGKAVSQLEYSRAIGYRVFKYLKRTMGYGSTYTGFPSVLEGYLDASWITNIEDHSSTTGWIFLLGGGAISWASKKQTCITNSNMESEFVA